MIYVCSDIHGDWDRYIKIYDTINLTNDDTLFILGDIIDRGNDGIKILKDTMYKPNVIPILGNHEFMAKSILSLSVEEITEDNIHKLDENFINNIVNWFANGGQPTLNQFRTLSNFDRQSILNYIDEFLVYEEITVNNQDYILLHAGISKDAFKESKSMWEYYLDELIFERMDYSKTYFKDKIIITGHTPVQYIPENNNQDTIFKNNNHIAIDGGCGFDRNLIVYCLDNNKIFYIN